MKKNYLLVAAFAMALVSCNKSGLETIEPVDQPSVKSNIVSLTANIPEFESGTKATIGSDGTFSWDDGDQIYVSCELTQDPWYGLITFTYNESTKKFEADPTTQGFKTVNPGGVTSYPVYGQYDGTKLSGLAKSFRMEGTVTSGETPSVTFHHQDAMLKVPFENVPSFANRIVLEVEGTVAKTIYPDDTSFPTSFTASIPLLSSYTGTFTFKLLDNNDNIIIEKHKNNVTLETGKYYTTPTITVGPVILIKNNVMTEKGEKTWTEIDDASGRINLHTYISGVKDFTSYNNTECQFNEIIISGNPYVYYVYPVDYDGQTVHVNIRCLGYDYPKLETNIVISGVTEYSFGFAQGLKKTSDKFIYAMFEGSDTAKCKVYVEEGGSAVFGAWWDTNPTQITVMYNDGSDKRFLNIYNITGCSASATFEPIENGNKYYMYDWSWASKIAFSDANGISDYYLIYKWEDPDHHVYNKDFTYLANLVY